MRMDARDIDWPGCPLIESVPGLPSGDPVFVGSRLPVSAVVENYQDFLGEGMTPDEAIAETLETYPSTPGGANAIRADLDEDVPHQLRIALAPRHDVTTTPYIGWAGVKNGALLKLIEED